MLQFIIKGIAALKENSDVRNIFILAKWKVFYLILIFIIHENNNNKNDKNHNLVKRLGYIKSCRQKTCGLFFLVVDKVLNCINYYKNNG